MHAGLSDVIESIRQPDYTGENRCLPCTVVNTLIVAGLAVIVGYFIVPLAGIALFGGGIAVIAFRGYLVPGTPELTKRYLPERIHRLFGTHVEPLEPEVNGDTVDLEALLQELGLVEECPDEDDLCLESTFEQTWYGMMAALEGKETQLERLADRLQVERDALSLELQSQTATVRYEGDRIGSWPSEAAFLADLAVAPVLDEHCPEWKTLEDDQQGAVIAGLRVFLDECPVCEGKISDTERTVESCCATRTRATVECQTCRSPLLNDLTQ